MHGKRGVVLSPSKQNLRECSAMWIKETLLDPAICSQHCCRVGFEQAGVMHALGYDDITTHTPDIDGFVAAPEADFVPLTVWSPHNQPNVLYVASTYVPIVWPITRSAVIKTCLHQHSTPPPPCASTLKVRKTVPRGPVLRQGSAHKSKT